MDDLLAPTYLKLLRVVWAIDKYCTGIETDNKLVMEMNLIRVNFFKNRRKTQLLTCDRGE